MEYFKELILYREVKNVITPTGEHFEREVTYSILKAEGFETIDEEAPRKN